jgi:flagellar biosynthesis protein FlhF
MRLKTFTAPSMGEAMHLVKAHLGEDAIIVSTQKGDGGIGVRITAAIETADEYDEAPESVADIEVEEDIADSLRQHNVPADLAERLIRTAISLDTDDPLIAMAGALDQHFKFQPLSKVTKRPLVLVGLPGAGKTLTAAKLATRAVMKKKSVNMISTDTVRAGGYEQLAAFTRVLGIDLMSAETPTELRDAMDACSPGATIIVDCAGGNPFDEDDVRVQVNLLRAIDGEIVFVAAAGGDPIEAAEIAEAYATMGARRLVSTRIDIARRLGAVLAAADAGRLTFAEVGISGAVAEGLAPLNPISLARLLLPNHAAVRDEAAE